MRLRSRVYASTESSSSLTPHKTLVGAPPPSHLEERDEDRDQYAGGGQYEDEEGEKLEPQRRRNPPRNRHPSGCGTHSGRRQ
ncbi:hypothetical protein Gotri_003983 [Gossypium trilobum]|uniref:Uncharacterized protein n=1 Tax=Gossypium trilobum TaxID=34281 RepID=A0A7J9F396_9ROSI|nr:hypothetical protein [Gossypium trilobum]